MFPNVEMPLNFYLVGGLIIKPVRLKHLFSCLFSFWNLFQTILIYQCGRDSKTFFTKSQKKDCCSSIKIPDFRIDSEIFNAYINKFKVLLHRFCHYLALVPTFKRNEPFFLNLMELHNFNSSNVIIIKFDYENNKRSMFRPTSRRGHAFFY